MNILVVDDNIDLLHLFKLYFAETGHNVYLASNGIEALEVIKDNQDKKFTLITDFDMPEMNGAELIDSIHRQSLGVEKIILISGRIDELDIKNLFNSDWNIHFFSKPFSFLSITHAIRSKTHID